MSNLNSRLYFMCLMSIIAGVGFFGLMIFSYMTEVLGRLFFVDSTQDWLYYTQAFGLLLIGFIMMPLGGLVIGRYGDTQGRRPALLLSLLGVSVFTFIMGLLPTTNQIGIFATLLFLLIKIGQSLSFGGLIPTLWVYASECLSRRHLGLSLGLIGAGCIVALLVLSVSIFVLENTSTQEQLLEVGWRLPFLMAGASGLILTVLVYRLDETPAFEHFCKNKHQSPSNAPLTIYQVEEDDKAPTNKGIIKLYHFIRKRLYLLLPAITLSWLTASLLIIIALLLPNLINSVFLIDTSVLQLGSIVSLVFMILGCLVFGWVADYVNAGKVMSIAGTFFIIQISLFFGHLISGGELILVFFALLGFGAGIVAIAPIFLVQLFAIKHRLTCVAVIYSSMYAIASSVLPYALGYATFYVHLAPALYMALVVVVTIFVSFYLYHLPNS